MRHILFEIPGLGWPIYGFGFMMVVGFLVGISLIRRRAAQIGLDPDDFSNLGMIALAAGIGGCRLFYVIHYWGDFAAVFDRDGFWSGVLNIINVRSGGLEWYGGLLLTIALMSVYAKVRKLSVPTVLDICIISAVIGLAFGRVGCLLNGCCYGSVCSPDYFGAVRFPKVEATIPMEGAETPVVRIIGSQPFADHVQAGWLTHAPGVEQWSLPVHPTQIYEMIGDLAIFFFVYYYFPLRRRPGEVICLVMALYAALRFTLEFVRTEPREVFGVLTIHQTIAILTFAAASVVWLWIQRLPPVKETYDSEGRPIQEPAGAAKGQAQEAGK